MITIEGCHFAGPVMPLIVFSGDAASCPVCHEVVYPQLVVLKNHDLYNYGTHGVWVSRDMGATIHDCSNRQATDSTLTVELLSAVRA